MENVHGVRRQPVAVNFISQNNYSEEPFRQIEYEILVIERGGGLLCIGNLVFEVAAGDYIFINPRLSLLASADFFVLK